MSVVTRNYQDIEFVSYISPDGIEYPIYGGRRAIMRWRSFGMPPINYISDRGPFQHGITVRDFRLNERVIELLPRERGNCKRQERWDAIGELSNTIRMNRGGPGRILVVLPDFTQREIFVRLLDGPSGDYDSGNNMPMVDMEERLQFLAEYPVWRDPSSSEEVFVLNPVDACLPICIPFCIAGGIIDSTVSVVYPGTWLSFPTIVIGGPINEPSIINLTTNERIDLIRNIAPGETVTIELGPQVDRIFNNFGDNLIGSVNNPNDLATFHIEVDPIAPGGVNDIQVIGSGADVGTGISFSYFTYYLAVPL